MILKEKVKRIKRKEKHNMLWNQGFGRSKFNNFGSNYEIE